MDTKLLQRIKDMVLEVNSTNKTNDKKIIMSKYEDLKKVLLYVYDDNKVFGITSKNYLKFEKNKKNLSIKRGIYLYGAPGSGKTYFIQELLKNLGYDIITYDAGDIRNNLLLIILHKII